MPENHQHWIELARNYLVYQRNLGMTEILAPRKSRDIETLEEIREDLGECTRCPLHPRPTEYSIW